jgi:hypothetical protein
MKRAVLALLGVAAVVGLLYAMTLSQAGWECEACVEFQGQSACRTVTGARREDAEREALSNACAFLASGVTQILACQRSEPTSLRCRSH